MSGCLCLAFPCKKKKKALPSKSQDFFFFWEGVRIFIHILLVATIGVGSELPPPLPPFLRSSVYFSPCRTFYFGRAGRTTTNEMRYGGLYLLVRPCVAILSTVLLRGNQPGGRLLPMKKIKLPSHLYLEPLISQSLLFLYIYLQIAGNLADRTRGADSKGLLRVSFYHTLTPTTDWSCQASNSRRLIVTPQIGNSRSRVVLSSRAHTLLDFPGSRICQCVARVLIQGRHCCCCCCRLVKRA